MNDPQKQQARVEAGLNDFLMGLLKALVLKTCKVDGKPFIGLTKADFLRGEECDLKFQKDADGDIRVAAIPGTDPQKTKIILPQDVIKTYRSM